jgi:uncharacterized protein with PIN domain
MIFICDVMLGKLAKYLRILGLNTIYIRNNTMLEDYKKQGDLSCLLTKRKKITGYKKCIVIKSDTARGQLEEIRYLISPFINSENVLTRCIVCNVELIKVEKTDIEQYIPEFVFHHYEVFKACPSCKKIYWKGSHAEHMSELIKGIINTRL